MICPSLISGDYTFTTVSSYLWPPSSLTSEYSFSVSFSGFSFSDYSTVFCSQPLECPTGLTNAVCPKLNSSPLLSLLQFLANDVIHNPGTSVRILSLLRWLPPLTQNQCFSNPHLKPNMATPSISTAIALVQAFIILTLITSLPALNPALLNCTYCFQSDHSKMQIWSCSSLYCVSLSNFISCPPHPFPSTLQPYGTRIPHCL